MMPVDDEPKRARTRDVVAEGLYIAAAATRLRLKNEILMTVLAMGANYNEDWFVPIARDTLYILADEADAAADQLAATIERAKGRHHTSYGTHDYRNRDVRNLNRRRKQSKHVAQQLRERAEDEAELHKLVEGAREAAWADVERNLERTLNIVASRPDHDADYEQMRSARMQSVRLVDLAKLEANRRSAGKG